MPTSDALIVVEDWISEHFFTTDARKESFQKLVLDRRKQWDSEDIETPRSKFTKQASKLATTLAALYSDDLDEASRAGATTQAHEKLLDVLGYLTGEFKTDPHGPVRFFSTAGVDEPALAVVTARPVETHDEFMVKDAPTLTTPWRPSDDAPDSEEVRSASRLVSTLFVREKGPSFALIMAGRWLVVAEKSRWPEGRYLAVDVQTVAERADLKKGGEVDRALTCLEAGSLAPDAEGKVWWETALIESIKHTVGVSQDLREGVRESIEIIANEVVNRRRQQELDQTTNEEQHRERVIDDHRPAAGGRLQKLDEQHDQAGQQQQRTDEIRKPEFGARIMCSERDRDRQEQTNCRLRLQLQEHPPAGSGAPLIDQVAIARIIACLTGSQQQMTAEPERPDGDQDRDHDLPRAGRLARRDRDNAGQASDQAGPECPADIDPSRGPGPALNEPGYRHNRRHRECHDDELEDQREQAHGAIFRRSHHMRINGCNKRPITPLSRKSPCIATRQIQSSMESILMS